MKVVLIIVLSYDVKLLILDEVIVGMDVLGCEYVLEILEDYLGDDCVILILLYIFEDIE